MQDDASMSLAVARLIDATCDEFDRALVSGATPRIESYLSQTPTAARERLVLELIGVEFDFRRNRGEKPDLTDYLQRFPELDPAGLAAAVHSTSGEADELIGRKLHVYQCVSLIGSGAMGRVYLALHHDLQRHCALKILSPRRGNCDAEYVTRFHLEGQAAAALIHPNIVTLHAVGRVGATHFLEMEFIQGRSLQQLIRDEGPLPSDQALRLATMIADGLAAAHRAEIVHRDVKPHNVLVTRAGVAKIGDFGLAKRVLTAEGDPLADGICGTPNYMAPELFRGSPASPASDVYALGLCLYQLLIGNLPWQSVSLSELIRSGRTQALPNIHDLRPELSDDVAACVAALTALAPEDRPNDAIEAAALLHAVLGIERDLETLLIEAFSNEPTITWVRQRDSFCVTRRLSGNRLQQVMLEPTQHSPDERLLLLYATCCPATPGYYEQALRENAIVMHASLAIRDVDGQPMFVVINAYPRSTVAPEEIRRSVLEIAALADQVEKLLTGLDRNY